MKRYSRYEGDFHDLVETPGGELKSWASDYEQRFVWDGGLSGGYGNLSASYFWDNAESAFAGADQSYAWGPDLSGTEQGAGGIGGLAIISAAASDLNPTAATYVPLYDGHGNVVSLRDTSTNELAAYTYGPYGGETTAAIGSRWASNPFRFSTKFTDAETGLVYYGYRYYLPSQGRWAGRDPIEELDGPNIVCFGKNNPILSADALGLFIELWYGNHLVLDPLTFPGSPTKWHHSKLWLLTDEHALVEQSPEPFKRAVSKLESASLSLVGPCNLFVLAMGAGPIDGELIAEFNRPRDISEPLQNATLVRAFSTSTAALSFIRKVQDANDVMNGNFQRTLLSYAFFPPLFDRYKYNSNSYISGLLQYLHMPVPTSGANTPGYDKPVPALIFERQWTSSRHLIDGWDLWEVEVP